MFETVNAFGEFKLVRNVLPDNRIVYRLEKNGKIYGIWWDDRPSDQHIIDYIKKYV